MNKPPYQDAAADMLRELWGKYARHEWNCGSRLYGPSSCDCGFAQVDINKAIDTLLAWKIAIIDATVVDWVYTAEHETNPRKAINDLLCWAQKIALDPAVSKDAADLHERIRVLEILVKEAKLQIDEHALYELETQARDRIRELERDAKQHLSPSSGGLREVK